MILIVEKIFFKWYIRIFKPIRWVITFITPPVFIFLVCVFITLLLWDIFKSQDSVSLGLKSVFWLGLSVILLLVTTLNLKIKNLRNLAIVLMIFTTIFSAFLVQRFVMVEKFSQVSSANSTKFLNPLWDEYLKIAKNLQSKSKFYKRCLDRKRSS